MIHPAYSKNLKYRPSYRVFSVYYCVAFLLCVVNFIPLMVDLPSSRAKVAANTENFLNVCYLLSIPLLFEFTLDTIASQFQALSVLKELEHRFGHGLLLISLFLVVFLVPGNFFDQLSAFVVNCVFAMLQTLVITGMYGKLLAHGNGHWTVRGSWAVILFFVLSELCTRFGMIYHSRSDLSYTLCASFALAYMVICFLIHWYLRKKFLAHYLGIKIGSSVPAGPSGIDDIVCFILQGIITVYLLVSLCVLCLFLVSGYDLEKYTNVEILKQLVLALCASILPGRMIRRSFILLRHEMDTKESFIRYISHEIRSPLSTTSLGLDYLLERMSESSKSSEGMTMSEALSVVRETKVTCELAMNTLNDFLMLDKIQSNMLQISTTECAAGDFMLSTVRAFRLQAETNEVVLRCSSQVIDGVDILSLPALTVQVDQFKTNQVLRNLLSNALKFTGAGGSIEVSLTLRNALTGEELESLHSDLSTCSCMVRYAVKDSGCGISKENLPKLFGQYVQFDADKLQGGKGSGLGLWLSKAIVEMHGGRIGATSEGEGKGCTFWFELPCDLVPVLSAATSFRSNLPVITANATENSADSLEEMDDVVEFEQKQKPNKRVSFPVSQEDSDTPQASEEFAAAGGGGGDIEMQIADIQPPKSLISSLMKRNSSNTSNTSLFKPSLKVSSKRAAKVGLLKVLLVDDSSIARKMVERSLASIHCICQHACDGQESVDIVDANMQAGETPFDVVLMDYYMPVMCGPEAIAALRTMGYKGIIIAVTGVNTDAEFATLLSAGLVDRVMVKPFRVDTFQTIVHEINSAKNHASKHSHNNTHSSDADGNHAGASKPNSPTAV